jgi:hypothetical protein
MFKTFYTADG